jgi:hypothetical protein
MIIKLKNQFLVSSSDIDLTNPHVATLANGGFAFAWDYVVPNAGGVAFQIFGENGSPVMAIDYTGPGVTISKGLVDINVPSKLIFGDSVSITWAAATVVFPLIQPGVVQRFFLSTEYYDYNGIGDNATISDSDFAIDPKGGFAALGELRVWTYDGAIYSMGVRSNRTADWYGQVNTFAEGRQHDPAAAESNLGYVVAWLSDSDAQTTVRARLLTGNGSALGEPEGLPDFRIDEGSGTNASMVSVAGISDYRFAATWVEQPAMGQTDVKYRLFGPNGAAKTPELSLTATATVGETLPNIVSLNGGVFLITWVEHTADNMNRILGQFLFSDGSKASDMVEIAELAGAAPSNVDAEVWFDHLNLGRRGRFRDPGNPGDDSWYKQKKIYNECGRVDWNG